ncbi:hypothetical protein C0993_010708 [Termitomyces sp. T159_Od127]|nr:hypothetical protein C0993_010708 [Termitomyces sp. T159_Od127]
MNSTQGVKSEDRESPSLRQPRDAHETADLLLPPPSSEILNQAIIEEPMQDPFPSVSLHRELKEEPKAEDEPSPSLSPTLNDEFSPQKFKLSPSPTPPSSTTNGTASMSSTPPPLNIPPSKKSQIVVQLIGDLPIARKAALATFNEIEANSYQYKTLGRSREALESMTCDCIFDVATDHPDSACGHDSDCINRLTQVECLPEDCRCHSHCRNQRFQKREYADIDIVQTELKGFGLRAESFLRKDTFIYEYVGEVVSPVSFKKRMREYAEEGIEHFYFMMLQKDEFIDATKSGGIGRFANHSCNPNCYVARWTVGQYVRMGIFAKRDIQKHEELTFNYNVDRYGYVEAIYHRWDRADDSLLLSHQAQTCYCGEPNCVGFIGGKTQTDAATMDDLVFDGKLSKDLNPLMPNIDGFLALGITDEADLLEVKGNKKKRGKKIDDPDFMPTMKPLVEKDIPKVIQAIRQTQSRKVLLKLLTRIKLTEDQAALRQIMRLRGFSLMTNVLEDHKSDIELINLALSCMSTWPLLNRNKVDDSHVIIHVRAIAEAEDDKNKLLAQSLVTHWDTLPLYTRISKRTIPDDNEEEIQQVTLYDDEEFIFQQRRGLQDPEIDISRTKYRPKPQVRRKFDEGPWTPPSLFTVEPSMPRPASQLKLSAEFSRESIRAVIAAAAEAEAAAAKAAAEAETEALAKAETKAVAKAARAARHEASKGEHSHRKKQKLSKKPHTEEEREAMKEKRMLKLVGAVVVKCMSKHSSTMDHDQFKKHAKELTQIITNKEKKSSSYKEGRLEKLSDEKVAKIKKFSKDYIAKILRKIEKSSKGSRESSSTALPVSSSTLQQTLQLHEGDGDGEDEDIVMGDPTLEDMNIVSDSDGDEEQEDCQGYLAVRDEDGDIQKVVIHASPLDDWPTAEPWSKMKPDSATAQPLGFQPPSDPRRRPPSEDFASEPPQARAACDV